MGSIVPTSLNQDLANDWNNFDGINCLFGWDYMARGKRVSITLEENAYVIFN